MMKRLTRAARLVRRIEFFDKKIYLAKISLNRAEEIWNRTGDVVKRELRDRMKGRLFYFCAALSKLEDELQKELKKKCR